MADVEIPPCTGCSSPLCPDCRTVYDRHGITVHHGDCLDVLRQIADESISAVVTDPPYELGFMGRAWDATGIAYNVDLWRECLRVLRPGGHLAAFGGTRTYHRMACAVEDAGFEIRDSIGCPSLLAWMHGQGFPKSKSQLKPAWEPIVVARRPFRGSEAANVVEHGTGAINIDATRVGTDGGTKRSAQVPFGPGGRGDQGGTQNWRTGHAVLNTGTGRWPANVLLSHAVSADGGDACASGCVEGCPVAELDAQSGTLKSGAWNGKRNRSKFEDQYGEFAGNDEHPRAADSGGASRFFPTFRWEAKAPTAERPKVNGKAHPTVKPLDLMRWLVRLVTPPGGLVLDPFAGTGTTGHAARAEGMRAVLIEQDADHIPLIVSRLDGYRQPTETDLLDLLDGTA